MLFGKPFRQERIADGTWERNVDDPSVMNMANLRVCEAELATSTAMGVDRDPRP